MWAFQSTLPRRERPCQGRPSASCHWHFNPRSREGSDGTGRQPRPSCPEFQSTLPRRERQLRVRPAHEQNLFQSTLPRRERPLHPEYHPPQYHFNPRSREGSDLIRSSRISLRAPFQSTLPRRERRVLTIWLLHLSAISIHAPAKGATHGRYACHLRQIISIHAPAKGATHQASDKYNPGIFQSTLPRRERRLWPGLICSTFIFQSTLPRRERPRHPAGRAS